MGYDDGVNTGISKWSYYLIKYILLFSFDLYDYLGFDSALILSLLTSTSFLYLIVYFLLKIIPNKGA